MVLGRPRLSHRPLLASLYRRDADIFPRRRSILLQIELLELRDLRILDRTSFPISGDGHAAARLAGVARERNESDEQMRCPWFALL
jgi:hypothetical protein